MASLYDDDERGPFIPFSVLRPPQKNLRFIEDDDEEEYVPITHILRDYWKEQRESMYCTNDDESWFVNNFYNNYQFDEEDLWSDSYNEEDDTDEQSSSEEPSTPSNEEPSPPSNQESPNDFDPLDNDPLFNQASKKFAYV